MKARKRLLIIVAVCSVIALFAVSAYAQDNWYTCTVLQAGPSFGFYFVRMDDVGSDFENAGHDWFRLRNGQEKEMLATALTSMSNGQEVWANVDLSKGGEPMLNALYLGPPAP